MNDYDIDIAFERLDAVIEHVAGAGVDIPVGIVPSREEVANGEVSIDERVSVLIDAYNALPASQRREHQFNRMLGDGYALCHEGMVTKFLPEGLCITVPGEELLTTRFTFSDAENCVIQTWPDGSTKNFHYRRGVMSRFLQERLNSMQVLFLFRAMPHVFAKV